MKAISAKRVLTQGQKGAAIGIAADGSRQIITVRNIVGTRIRKGTRVEAWPMPGAYAVVAVEC